MKGSGALPLTAPCDGCGAPDGVWQPHHEYVYCPRCAAKNDDYDRAQRHLSSLIAPAVAAWREHWLGRGMEPDLLVELLENSDELVDQVRALNGRDNPKDEAAVT